MVTESWRRTQLIQIFLLSARFIELSTVTSHLTPDHFSEEPQPAQAGQQLGQEVGGDSEAAGARGGQHPGAEHTLGQVSTSPYSMSLHVTHAPLPQAGQAEQLILGEQAQGRGDPGAASEDPAPQEEAGGGGLRLRVGS